MEDEEPAADVTTIDKRDLVARGLDLANSFDNLLASLYTGLIAGTIVLMLHEKLPEWVGACLMLGLVCFVLGLGHTLLHIALASKTFLAGAMPGAGVDESTEANRQLEKLSAYRERAYSAQLFYILVGLCFGAAAIFVQLWHYAWRAGLVVLLIASGMLAIGALILTWRGPISRYGRGRPPN